MVGLGTLPSSSIAAAKCSTIGPGANLNGCDLSGMDLSGVNLSGANLRGANLEGTNLDGANLSGANLNNARVTEGALDDANTSGANLRGIRYVPALDPVVTITMSPQEGYCIPTVHATGFAPNTTYSYVEYRNNNGSVVEVNRGEVTTDATGASTFATFSFVEAANVSVQAIIGGVSSAFVPYLCS
jgi:uncharacterized protein YjbI with pentapeptide repeats